MPRILPHSLEAEGSVLGGILLKNQVLSQLDQLETEDFYDPKHRVVYAAMRALDAQSRPIDPVTLEAELSRTGSLDAIGGIGYLSGLAVRVPTADNVEHYAAIIQEKRTARGLMLAASEIAAKGYGDYGELQEYLDESESRIFAITQRMQRGGPQPVKALVKEVFHLLDERYMAKGGVTGVPTGFADLDSRTAGLQPGELTILAARPAMGKTALALSIVLNASLHAGYPALVCSLEMSSTQLAERMLCSAAGVDSTALRRGRIDRGDMTQLTNAANTLSLGPILIDETPALTLRELRGRARRFVGQRDLFGDKPFGLIVVDYLQLMQGSQQARSGSREQEISEISRGLKALSKELSCPVLALSQLNRSLEARADKRPQLSDLRESGAIEQDADVIYFIYRDEVYNPQTERPGVAELIIGKNRHGPIGTVETRFDARFTRFQSLSTRTT